MLSHPLVLVGFVLFIVLGVFKVLFQSKVLNSFSKKANKKIIEKILLYTFIISSLTIVLGFVLQFKKSGQEAPPEINPHFSVEKKLPFHTGWIFVGYFQDELNTYIETQYATLVHRSDTTQNQVTPAVGDVLKLQKERNIVIADFKNTGLNSQMTSPLDYYEQNNMEAILRDEDLTDMKLPKDLLVIVRDVSVGKPSDENDHTHSVWARIVECHPDDVVCKIADEKISKE